MYGVRLDAKDVSVYGMEIAALEEDERPAELSIWTKLLFLFALLTTRNQPQTVIHAWCGALFTMHPLAESIPTANVDDFDEEMMEDFVRLDNGDPSREQRGLCWLWASEVAEKYAFPLEGIEDENPFPRICMYMPRIDESSGREDDMWAYGEAEV